MITETVMKAGGWSMRVDPDATPYWLRRKMAFFANIIVTPTYSGTDESFAALKARSLYSGIITRRALRRGEIGGVGLLGYLGTGKATAGPWHAGYETLTFPATFVDLLNHWFNAGVQYGNGIRIGTAYTANLTTFAALPDGTLPDMKATLDTVSAQTYNEYRVTHQGLIDYGMLVYPSPKILISPDVRTGSAGEWRLWEPVDWDPEADVNDYRNTGRVLIQDKSNSALAPVNWTLPNVVPQMRCWNNDYSHTCIYTNTEKVVESMNLGDAGNVATAVANNRAAPHLSIPCKVDVFAVTRYVGAGDYLWVYDALEGIRGDTHVGISGFDCPALKHRVQSITWPVEEGMGVYLIGGEFLTTPNLPTVYDLTPYVQWETGPAQLDLGPPPALFTDQSLID